MYYCVYGQGKTILYLHGWGASGEAFAPTVKRLPDYLNLTVDFAGFGRSPMPPREGFSVDDYAEETAEFLRRGKFGKVTVVAHSFGCRVAVVLAAKHPDLVEKALFFAPAGIRRFSLKRWFKIRFYKIKKRVHPNKIKPSGSADFQATPDALKSTFVKVVNQDLSAYARRMRCKTLIIAAKADSAVPYRDAKRLHKLIKNSEFTGIGGDHFALFYSPAAFAKIIRLFMEERCF